LALRVKHDATDDLAFAIENNVIVFAVRLATTAARGI
jgi:hypothetical protein